MSDKTNVSRRRFIQGMGVAGLGAAFPGIWLSKPARAGELRVGFIYVGSRDDYGYNQSHAQGARALRDIPGVTVLEEENVPETIAVQRTMESMINLDDVNLVFPTSFGYYDPHVLRVAGRNPNILFRHCGGLYQEGSHPENAGSYFGYIDECQYLNGIVAGHATRSKRLGFIAARAIPQVVRNINAYTMGARSVDPDIRVQVIYTGDWHLPVREAEATNGLADQGVDVITCHVDSPMVIAETCEARGINFCGYHADQSRLAPNGYLTGAEWKWETPYKRIVEAVMAGETPPHFLRGGLADGFVQPSAYGSRVSDGARRQADEVKEKMMEGDFVIFEGPIKDNEGNTVIADGESHEQRDTWLEQMDWLVEGVRV